MLDQPEVVVRAHRGRVRSVGSRRPRRAARSSRRRVGLGRRLPLVAPDHVETGAIEGEMEASDPGEQLRGGGGDRSHPRSRGRIRVMWSPSRLGGEGSGRVLIPDLAREINLGPRLTGGGRTYPAPNTSSSVLARRLAEAGVRDVEPHVVVVGLVRVVDPEATRRPSSVVGVGDDLVALRQAPTGSPTGGRARPSRGGRRRSGSDPGHSCRRRGGRGRGPANATST